MNELEQIFADVKKEGLPLEDALRESAPESQPEKEPETETPAEGDIPAEEKSEDNLPFHQHPRWIERENELNELRERDEQTSRELAELKAFKETSTKQTEDTTVPEWFSELYGDNQVAWSKYNAHEQTRTEEIENRIIARQREEQTKASQEASHWDKWVDTEVTKLESKGYKFERNELIQTMVEFRPTDADNNFDFEAGYKIYDALREKADSSKSDARKQLADTTTVTSIKGETPKRDYMTPAELRGRSWGSL